MNKYADSILCKLSRQELVEYIRCLENNLESAEECNERQYQMLMNYEKLKEQHKLIEVPCDIGDLVYFEIDRGKFIGAKVTGYIYLTTCGFCLRLTDKLTFGKEDTYTIPFSDVGKSAFLTWEEVEKELAKRKHIHNMCFGKIEVDV